MSKVYWNLYRTQLKSPWPKVGVAFQNRDGSYNLRFKGNIKVTDRVQMREPRLKQQSKYRLSRKALKLERPDQWHAVRCRFP